VCVKFARHNIDFRIIVRFVILDLQPSAENIMTRTKFRIFPSNGFSLIASYPITKQFSTRLVCCYSTVHVSTNPVKFSHLWYHHITFSKKMSLTSLPSRKFALLLLPVQTVGNTIMALSCSLSHCCSTFVRPRHGKFFFHKTRARSQQITRQCLSKFKFIH